MEINFIKEKMIDIRKFNWLSCENIKIYKKIVTKTTIFSNNFLFLTTSIIFLNLN